jgi:hypothetical protein
VARREVTDADRRLAARRREDYLYAAGLSPDQLAREHAWHGGWRRYQGSEARSTLRMLESLQERRAARTAAMRGAPYVSERVKRIPRRAVRRITR